MANIDRIVNIQIALNTAGISKKRVRFYVGSGLSSEQPQSR